MRYVAKFWNGDAHPTSESLVLLQLVGDDLEGFIHWDTDKQVHNIKADHDICVCKGCLVDSLHEVCRVPHM